MERTLRLMAGLHREETGQDLVEYALVMVLIALAATAGMGLMAASINSAFTQVGNILGKYAS